MNGFMNGSNFYGKRVTLIYDRLKLGSDDETSWYVYVGIDNREIISGVHWINCLEGEG